MVGRASVDQLNVVRVDLDYTARLRFAMEGQVIVAAKGAFNCGAAVIVVPGAQITDTVVDAVGLGLSVGIQDSSFRLRIGGGFMVENKAERLGSGIERNKELPMGTALRLEEFTGVAWYLAASWTILRK